MSRKHVSRRATSTLSILRLIGFVLFTWGVISIAGASGQDSTEKKRIETPDGYSSVKELADGLPCTVSFFDVAERPAFLIRPDGNPSHDSMPWVWYAPIIGGQPNAGHAWMLKQWLEQGIGMAGVDVGESYGSPRGRAVYEALWEVLHTRYRMSDRPCLLPQSRGGLMLLNWATENPSHVSCIAGIFPVCDLRSYPGLEKACGAYDLSVAELESHLDEHNPINRLTPLTKASVPILLVHGDADMKVPLKENSLELDRRYRELNGKSRLIVISGKGHQVCNEFFHCQQLVDFVAAHAGANLSDNPEHLQQQKQ